jgi:hypothetical protein
MGPKQPLISPYAGLGTRFLSWAGANRGGLVQHLGDQAILE